MKKNVLLLLILFLQLYFYQFAFALFCPKCGVQNLDEALFCKKCGNKIPQLTNDDNNSKNTIFKENIKIDSDTSSPETYSKKSDEDLIKIVRSGNIEQLKESLAGGANIEARTQHGDTILEIASDVGNYQIASCLIEKGANLNSQNVDNWVPLMSAVDKGHSDVVELLLEKGAKADFIANNGKEGQVTALFLAVKNGDIKIINILLDWGADINQQNDEGWTALMTAVVMARADLVKILIEKGADVNKEANLKGAGKRTAMMLAKNKKRKEIIDLLEKNK